MGQHIPISALAVPRFLKRYEGVYSKLGRTETILSTGHRAACDWLRRNDLNGRGNLSEENLAGFTEFFLTIRIDQVAFVERLMQAEQLRARILHRCCLDYLADAKDAASMLCNILNEQVSRERCRQSGTNSLPFTVTGTLERGRRTPYE
jgi:hypothetical protein